MPYKNKLGTCSGCGNEYLKAYPTKKYCTKECYLSIKRNQADYTKCMVCNEIFRPRVNQVKNGWGKYCSRKCYSSFPKSEEFKKKISDKFRGASHPNWKGGIMKGRKDRNLSEYKNWRTQVFVRDKYMCQWCGIKNEKGLGRTVKLEADHIQSWTEYPELRYEIDNGRTLCKSCHSDRTSAQHKERIKNATKI